MNSPSIQRTLLIRGGLGIGGLMCVVFASVYLLVRHSLYLELDTSITETAALLANQIEYEADAITYEWEEGIGNNLALSSQGLFQFWDQRTGMIKRSPGLHSHDLPKFTGHDGQPLLRNVVLPNGNQGRAIGLRVYPFVLPKAKAEMLAQGTFIDPKSMPQTLVVAGNAEPLHQTLQTVQRIVAAGVSLTFIFGFFIIRGAIRVSLHPIDELAEEMKHRAENQLDTPMDISRRFPAELIPLATNFDFLLSRVATIRQREKDFIRHAAHELRTPVAGLRATTDLALSKSRKAEDYVEYLTSCQKVAIEMGELVKRLSALARIGLANEPVLLTPFDVKAHLSECLARFEPLFAERGLRVASQMPDHPLMVKSDAYLLRIIFNNLLDNALSYARPTSEIQIRAINSVERVEITFSNVTDDLSHNPERFFEPLFRKDSARVKEDAHLGIGLTLASSAANSVGASIVAQKDDNDWIRFVVSLPAP
jgi:signal transduction histidine kinase